LFQKLVVAIIYKHLDSLMIQMQDSSYIMQDSMRSHEASNKL